MLDEVKKAIRELKTSKITGKGEHPAEIFKYDSEQLCEIPFYKNERRLQYANYRGITHPI